MVESINDGGLNLAITFRWDWKLLLVLLGSW